MRTYPFSDLSLARRLESAEGKTNAAFVDARRKLFPGEAAEWRDFGGALAMFDAVGSPLTQTFCLGMFSDATPAQVDAIERFFEDRGAKVFHEVSPLADVKTMNLLSARGYHPIEFTSVMYQPIGEELLRGDAEANGISVSVVADSDIERWAETAAAGWGEQPELADFMRALGRITASSENVTAFLAAVDGRPAGSAALSMQSGVAILAGASTIPESRRRGAQQELLRARLRHAVEHGCDIAMIGAAPGSASQRNAERRGFRIAYTRVKWER